MPFWAVVLEKALESPLDCKEIQPVHPQGDQSWVFIGRIDAEAETPILWPPHAKTWLIGKNPDAGRDWGQEEKGTTEDEMAGWQHRLDGHEFEYTLGVGDGQGSLECCDSWGHTESDTTERLHWLKMQLNPLQWSKHWSLMPTCNMASGNYQRQCASIIHLKAGLCDRKCHLPSQQHGLRTCCTVKLLCTKEISFFSSPISLISQWKKGGHKIKIPVFAFNLPLTSDASLTHTGAFT